MTTRLTSLFVLMVICLGTTGICQDHTGFDFSPPADEQQLPRAMHAAMQNLPHVTVGQENADLVGTDQLVLQAAVEYIGALGGGTVEIRPGQYLMHDSLHLRTGVIVRGTPGQTVLRKADAVVSELALDGDFGEQQITLRNPAGFEVGHGVAIWDERAGGFHTTVARITGRRGNTFSIDKPLMADCMVQRGAQAGTLFPVVSGYNITDTRVDGLTIEGNKQANTHLNGCRGAGIFLYRAFGTVIENCVVRNYNGDGISFQQSNDVSVLGCTSERNSSLGIHPGSGSQRPTVRNCIARGNGTDGLFLCWRVRHGLFEDNVMERNGRFGISIGHKDSDNLLQRNQIRGNRDSGVYFRDELLGMAAHRNRLKDNLIENNGSTAGTAGIRVRGATNDLTFEGNIVRDTRDSAQQTQTVGVLIEQHVGNVVLKANQIDTVSPIEDGRPGKVSQSGRLE